MKTIQEIFPSITEDSFSQYSYDNLVESFGEVILYTRQNDYQGDSWYILYHDQKLGYLQFGWGSCSGCDALQGCSTVRDLEELLNSLRDSVLWFDDISSFAHYFKTHDWEGDYASEDRKPFLKDVEVLVGILLDGKTRAPLLINDEKFSKVSKMILEGKL